MNKKGYFFVVDAIIALFVLVLGLVLAFSYVYNQPSDDQVTFFSHGTLEFLINTKLGDLNYAYLDRAFIEGNMTRSNSIATQIGELFFRVNDQGCAFCGVLMNDFINNITTVYVSEQYSMVLLINHTTLYNRSLTPAFESRMLIPAKRLIFGSYQGEIWGPYPMEVWVWI